MRRAGWLARALRESWRAMEVSLGGRGRRVAGVRAGRPGAVVGGPGVTVTTGERSKAMGTRSSGSLSTQVSSALAL